LVDDASIATAAQIETRVEFPDNRLLAELCGEFDRNLTTIETAQSIQIVRRGNQLFLVGDGDARVRAESILQSLYTRLEQGRHVLAADVTAELRMNVVGGDATKTGKQMEMFRGGAVEIKTRKKLVEPRTEAQKAYVRSLFKNELSFGIGPAGTGKTYLAVAVAVSMFITGRVDKIILSRPAVEAGERLGFLPGDMKEKVDPYMQPLYDALRDMIPHEKLESYIENGTIQIAPLAFMRGRTLDHAFVILDEGQNTTHAQMKMFLTRMGKDAKFLLTGDPGQIDLPRRTISGLKEALLILKDIEGVGMIFLDDKDVIRHKLVKKVIEAYKHIENRD